MKTHYLISKNNKDDDSSIINYFSLKHNDTELFNPNHLFTSTFIDNMFVLEEFISFTQIIVGLYKNTEDMHKVIYKRISDFGIVLNLNEEIVHLDYDFMILKKAFKLNKDRNISYDDLKDFNLEYPIIFREMVQKVETLRDTFFINMYDDYQRKSRRSQKKTDALDNLKVIELNRPNDITLFIEKLASLLKDVQNIVIKDDELISYLDQHIFENVKNEMSFQSIWRTIPEKTFYSSTM